MLEEEERPGAGGAWSLPTHPLPSPVLGRELGGGEGWGGLQGK
jgi:hypothetical protein